MIVWVYSYKAPLANYFAPCGIDWGDLVSHGHLGWSVGSRLVSLTYLVPQWGQPEGWDWLSHSLQVAL